jgi:hypothetical protein
MEKQLVKDRTAAKALEFVKAVKLPRRPSLEGLEGLEKVGEFDFDAAKNQALVVGSGVISFVKGVTEERRNDIVNCALLAQLAATKKVGDASDIIPWYKVYFETLSNIGWVIQERSFTKHTEASTNLDAHQAIIKVATALLGPSPAALDLVMTTLGALQEMSKDSPFFTIFNRESQKAKAARFQITLAEEDENGRFLISLMAFALSADAKLIQVLFFRFRSNKITLKHASGKVTINTDVLATIRPAIKERVVAFAQKFVKQLPDL